MSPDLSWVRLESRDFAEGAYWEKESGPQITAKACELARVSKMENHSAAVSGSAISWRSFSGFTGESGRTRAVMPQSSSSVARRSRWRGDSWTIHWRFFPRSLEAMQARATKNDCEASSTWSNTIGHPPLAKGARCWVNSGLVRAWRSQLFGW